jgi:hypothetical protein
MTSQRAASTIACGFLVASAMTNFLFSLSLAESPFHCACCRRRKADELRRSLPEQS